MQLSSYLLLALDVALPLLLFSGISFVFLVYRKNGDNPGYFPGFLAGPGVLIHPQSKKEEEKWQEVIIKEQPEEGEVKKSIVFTAEEVKTITGDIETLMRVSTPFLKHRYSIRDMAEQLGIPSYQLSAFINQNTGMNFNDFINKERIAYCIKLIDEDQIEGLNLFGLSDKCGFSNRNTFRNAFKKFTGKTPSIFIKDN